MSYEAKGFIVVDENINITLVVAEYTLYRFQNDNININLAFTQQPTFKIASPTYNFTMGIFYFLPSSLPIKLSFIHKQFYQDLIDRDTTIGNQLIRRVQEIFE